MACFAIILYLFFRSKYDPRQIERLSRKVPDTSPRRRAAAFAARPAAPAAHGPVRQLRRKRTTSSPSGSRSRWARRATRARPSARRPPLWSWRGARRCRFHRRFCLHFRTNARHPLQRVRTLCPGAGPRRGAQHGVERLCGRGQLAQAQGCHLRSPPLASQRHACAAGGRCRHHREVRRRLLRPAWFLWHHRCAELARARSACADVARQTFTSSSKPRWPSSRAPNTPFSTRTASPAWRLSSPPSASEAI